MTNQVEVLREGLKLLPEVAAHHATDTPDLRSIFTPRSHEGALDPTREIVVGDRGVGKSFWSSVLKDDVARAAIAPIYPRLKLTNITVSLGFSEAIARDEYPSQRTISSLLENNVPPEIVWRAVIINNVNPTLLQPEWCNSEWHKRCEWIRNNPQKEEAILSRFDADLRSRGK